MFVENQMTLVVHSVKQSALYIAKIKKRTLRFTKSLSKEDVKTWGKSTISAFIR